MRAVLSEVDTLVQGRAILDIVQPALSADLPGLEAAWVRDHHPRMATVKIDCEDLPLVHAFEDLGFRFVECQLTLRRRVTRLLPVDAEGFLHARVETEAQLAPVLALAQSIFTTDRYSRDERLAMPAPGRRYVEYLRRAFAAPDQEIWTVVDKSNGTVASFGSHLNLPNHEVRSLLGGLHPDYQGSGVGMIADYLGNNLMYNRGVKVLWTAVTTINYPVLPVHLNHMGYRITRSMLVLRKLYD